MTQTLQQLTLTFEEARELETCEAVIRAGLHTFVEVGTALMSIRDKRLYREGHGTFEDYCREVWQLDRRRAYQLIEAAGVVVNVKNFSQIEPPSNDSQARVLAQLPPEDQPAAWSRAVETAPNGKVTAAHVRSVVEESVILRASKDIRAERAEARRAERFDKLTEIANGNRSLTTDRLYPVIYCDPPWRYEHIETESRAIENQYPTMSLDDICSLPVADIATPDCVLFLWATSPKLSDALCVVGAWGFKYRTCAVWMKDKIGMGYYFRQQHELLLVAVRGTPPAPAPGMRPPSVFVAGRVEHSVKPELFYAVIEGMYPNIPKIELFARNARNGWDSWGNES